MSSAPKGDSSLAGGFAALRMLWKRPIFVLFISLLSGGLGLGLLLMTKPVYSNATFRTPVSVRNFEFPFLEEKGQATEKIVRFDMKVGRIHPTRFVVHVQDVVKVIRVNGNNVIWLNQATPYAVVDAGPWLKEGNNSVRVAMLNYKPESYFYWLPSLSDPWFLTIIGLGLCSLACGVRWIQLIWPAALENGEAVTLYLAIAVRFIYTCGTPYSVRAYDWEGHLEYIQYVARNLSFPALDSGWETFQPPLFYGLYGLFGHVIYALGGSLDFAIIVWQLLGLAIAAMTMVAALWTARVLFPGPANGWRLLFFAAVAAIPSLAFFSSRISNDILFALVSFAFLGAFLQFWRDQRWYWWLAVSFLAALGLLTKSTALIFVPLAGMSLLFATGFSWSRKSLLMASFFAVIGIVAGTSLVHRAMESGNTSSFVVRNLENLDPAQRMTPTLLKFVTFNPIRMLEQPFTWVGNNPRYDLFPEFLFKSALFSEGYPGGGYLLPGQCILGCALILLGFSAFGLWRTLRSTAAPAWPLFVTVLGFISAQMFGVFTGPYACLQNFRYSIILIIPFVYFAVKGIELSRGRLQSLGRIAAGIFIGLCVLFILTQRGVLT